MKNIFTLIFVAALSHHAIAQAKAETDSVRSPHEIQFYATPVLGWLQYSTPDGKSRCGFNLGAGIDYIYWVSPNWGFGIGAKYMRYTGKYSFNGYVVETQQLDLSDPEIFPNGDPYILRSEFNQTETQQAHFAEVPLKVNFAAPLTPKLDFRAAVGFNAGYCLSTSQSMDPQTSYSRIAQFTESHYTIDDAPSLGLGTFNNFTKFSTGKLFSHSLGIVADLGVAFRLADKTLIHTALTGGYGFNNIQKKSSTNAADLANIDAYSGVTNTNLIVGNGIHTLFVGAKVGISFAFGQKRTKAAPTTTAETPMIVPAPTEEKTVKEETVVVAETNDVLAKAEEEKNKNEETVKKETVVVAETNDVLAKAEEEKNKNEETVEKEMVVVAETNDVLAKAEEEKQENSNELPTFDNIEFEFNSSKIAAAYGQILDRVASELRCNTALRIDVLGHTDNIGTASVNQRLSEQRARAVRSQLLLRGVAAQRINAQGFGYTRPLSPNTTPDARRRNRRVEIRISETE